MCIGASPCSGDESAWHGPAAHRGRRAPSLANTVEGRFIGRLTPDSDRFNGAFQAGQGINPELQDGSAFVVSPRVGFVYDLTGEAVTIIRGGWGIFYDRPQGNMVFDMIANAPGVLNSTVQWGTLQGLTSGGGDPNPVLAMNPTVYDFEPPKVTQWNLGIQRKLFRNFMFDLAYVGSTSDNLLRQVQINALPFGATFAAANQDPTRARQHDAGRDRAADRPAAALSGLRRHPHVGLQRLRATTTRCRPASTAGTTTGSCSRSSTCGARRSASTTTTSRPACPNPTDEQIRRLDYSLTDYDRPHNFVDQLRLPDAGSERSPRRWAARQQLADLRRLPLDERPSVRRRLQHPGHRRRQPDRHRRQPERAHRR